MSPTRLPVYRPTTPGAYIYPEPPRPLPVAAVAVLDASAEGAASVGFVACLGRELAQRGRSVGVALASFEPDPSLDPALRAAFAPAQTLCALAVHGSESAWAEQLARESLWLLIGPGALAFAAPLLIVLGADTPLLRWPDPLRARRERISLALSGDGLAVAKALAPLLAAI